MKSIRNCSNLRNTKAAIVGSTIAIVALAGAYFHNEFQKENIVAYITKPEVTSIVESDYYEKLTQIEDLTIEETPKLFSR